MMKCGMMKMKSLYNLCGRGLFHTHSQQPQRDLVVAVEVEAGYDAGMKVILCDRLNIHLEIKITNSRKRLPPVLTKSFQTSYKVQFTLIM